jgi:hypothetical protein
MKSLALLTLFLVSSFQFGFSETLRGSVEQVETLEIAAGTAKRFDLGMNDLGALDIEGDVRFLRGVQLEIQVPGSAQEFPGSFALYILRDVSPEPEPSVMTLQGTRVALEPIPLGDRFFYSVPAVSDHQLRSTVDARVAPSPLGTEYYPLVFSIIPVMKGITPAAAEGRFVVTARPLLLDRGALRLSIMTPEGEEIREAQGAFRNFSLSIDGREVGYTGEDIVLDTGLHRLSLESQVFENETVTFGVERGTIAEMTIELERPKSEITVDAPQNAELFVNGIPWNRNEPLTLDPGDHTILFELGDFSVSRRFQVEPKKDYEIVLSLDIMIREE